MDEEEQLAAEFEDVPAPTEEPADVPKIMRTTLGWKCMGQRHWATGRTKAEAYQNWKAMENGELPGRNRLMAGLLGRAGVL